MPSPPDGLDVGDEREGEVKKDAAVAGICTWRY